MEINKHNCRNGIENNLEYKEKTVVLIDKQKRAREKECCKIKRGLKL